jgi:hypothetical protein
MDKNSVAKDMFNVSYGALSEWGKMKVDSIVYGEGDGAMPDLIPPYQAGLADENTNIGLNQRVAQLENTVKVLLEDLEDIWRELEDERVRNST